MLTTTRLGPRRGARSDAADPIALDVMTATGLVSAHHVKWNAVLFREQFVRVMQYRTGHGVRLLVESVVGGPAWDVTDGLGGRGGDGFTGAIKCARDVGVSVFALLSELADRATTSLDVDARTATRRGENTASHGGTVPVSAPEVWAAGVTYKRSREARVAESLNVNDFYARVYRADRPELFLKDDAGRRTVGPGGVIGIRGDSTSSVPEPELALVLDSTARVVGVTLANDVTARDIEGENPLYLPQAKIFARGCALGPCILVVEGDVDDFPPFEINLVVSSADGEVRFAETCSTAEMARNFNDLAAYLTRYNVIEDGTVLLTGTGIIPPLEFGLRDGDRVTISSSAIGVLTNEVEELLTAPDPAPLDGTQPSAHRGTVA